VAGISLVLAEEEKNWVIRLPFEVDGLLSPGLSAAAAAAAWGMTVVAEEGEDEVEKGLTSFRGMADQSRRQAQDV
jgi:hypothetical protein